MEKLLDFLVDRIILLGPKLISAVLVILAFWLIAKFIDKMINKVGMRIELDLHVTSLLAQTSRVTIVVFGVVTALGTFGINVSALVAGLGLTGFALGFALKDTISNLLAGVLILIYHPFNIGENIKVSGYEGKVISIDLRYTKLENADSTVLIPNSKLFTDPITILKS